MKRKRIFLEKVTIQINKWKFVNICNIIPDHMKIFLNLHPWTVGVAIDVGPANDKSTDFVFSRSAWKFGSKSAI